MRTDKEIIKDLLDFLIEHEYDNVLDRYYGDIDFGCDDCNAQFDSRKTSLHKEDCPRAKLIYETMELLGEKIDKPEIVLCEWRDHRIDKQDSINYIGTDEMSNYSGTYCLECFPEIKQIESFRKNIDN